MTVCFSTTRSWNRTLTIDDFEPDTWKDKVESYIQSEHERFPRYAIDLSVYCTGKRIANAEKPTVLSGQTQNTSQDRISDGPSAPPVRKTWTNKLLAQNKARDQHREDKATVTKDIKERWICSSSNYENHSRAGVCWIDKHGVYHHVNNYILLKGWANSVIAGNYKKDKPSIHIKKHTKLVTVERQNRKKTGSKKELEKPAAEHRDEERRLVEERREEARRRQDKNQAKIFEQMEKMLGIQMTHSQHQIIQSLMGNMATSFPQI